MADKVVKTMQDMINENKKFIGRVVNINVNSLSRLSQINFERSRKIVNEHGKFRGTLLSQIALNSITQLKFQVISTAPHSYSVETGIVNRGWTRFDEEPGLEDWVRTKLMSEDPRKDTI